MFRFANVEMLWCLVVVPCLLLVMVVMRVLYRRRVQSFAQGAMQRLLMPYASRSRYWVRAGFFLLACISLIIGLARPQYGLKQVKTKREGIEVMVVLDVSRSMLAQDVQPSRLARAKMEIIKLLGTLREDRIGLILFAGKAYVQLPITSDFVAARQFISSVSTDMISEQGTALGAALELAYSSFSPQAQVGKAIVVIFDGENHEDDPLAVAQQAEAHGVVIHTVGIGSPTGAPIPLPGGGLKRDGEGRTVVTHLDEQTLAQVALSAHGLYMRATNTTSGLSPIVAELDKMQKGEFEQVAYANFNERYQVFFLAALIFAALGCLVFERKNPWVSVEHLFERVRR